MGYITSGSESSGNADGGHYVQRFRAKVRHCSWDLKPEPCAWSYHKLNPAKSNSRRRQTGRPRAHRTLSGLGHRTRVRAYTSGETVLKTVLLVEPFGFDFAEGVSCLAGLFTPRVARSGDGVRPLREVPPQGQAPVAEWGATRVGLPERHVRA
jgi:hypothetical protein